jgi:hypothetical protein
MSRAGTGYKYRMTDSSIALGFLHVKQGVQIGG